MIENISRFYGETGVHHNLPTPYGVEKSMDNSLHRTGGVAPP